VGNSEETDAVLHEVARLKRSKEFAGLARALLRVKTAGLWRGLGFKSFAEWGEHVVERKRSMLYKYVEIARDLPDLSGEQMNRIGVSRCICLASLARERGKVGREWVEKAEKLGSPNFELEVQRALRKVPDPDEFGEPIEPNFRGMAYAPINEQGVVYLFGMVSRDLKFRVEAVRAPYPDCIAKEQICEKPERWRAVRIEFEYLSSNFKHRPEGADLIVCWEDDLAARGKKPPLRVIELKSAIRYLPRT